MTIRPAQILAACCFAALLGGCGIVGPAPMPTTPVNPLGDARTIGTTTILPIDAPAGVNLWIARQHETAEQMLRRWSTTAGFTVDWQAGKDNLVAANAAIAAPFDQAVVTAFNEGWPNVTPALRPEIHTENNVIVVRQDSP